jgi:hypothetical protein
MRGFGIIGFVFYLIIGVLLFNIAFNFIQVDFLTSIEKWIIIIGGILVIFGGINYLRANRYPGY